MEAGLTTEGFRVRGLGFRVRRRPILLVALFGAGMLQGGMAAGAQTARSPELDALLNRIEFNSSHAPATLGKELADLAERDLAALCEMIVEPGTGDDTKARMALHGLALYAGSEATDEQRARFVKTLCETLEGDKPAPVKTFLVRQLQLGADQRAIPTLVTLLNNEELCEPAAQAMLSIGGDGAAKAFAKALPSAQGKRRVTIVKALRVLPQTAAVPLLLEDATSEDRDLRVNALGALAASGDPRATATLLNAARANAGQERAQVTGYVLELAEALAAAGHNDDAARLCRELLVASGTPQEVHVRCAALDVLAGAFGADGVGEVVAALTSENPELRAAAMTIAVAISGPAATDAYVSELKTASAAGRAAILTVLSRRSDEAAWPAAQAALKDEDKEVRIAAVKAASALGPEKATEALIAFLDTDQADEREVAQDALVESPSEKVSGQVAAAIKWSPARVRGALLEVLGRRGAETQLEVIYEQTTDVSEPVRIAAIGAIGQLAREDAVGKLAKLLKRVQSDAEREALETALVATAKRAPSPFKRIAYVIVSIDKRDARQYASMLRVLGRIGELPGIRTLQEAAQDPRPEVREAAIRAFLDWPDATAVDDVLDIARETEELKYHVLAMRAYARQIELDPDRPVEETLRLFDNGMSVARRVEEKRLLLARLGDVKDAQVLDKLAVYLDDEALRSETGSAMIGAARKILPAGWARAREALDLVLEKVDDERVRRHAEDVRKEIAEYEDYVTDWLVSGPYEEEGKDGKALFDVVFPPELPDARDVQWNPQPVRENPEWYWLIDLDQSVGGDNRAAYLRTYVWSPRKQEALLELGSDDGLKVWLNGEVIHANNVPRGCGRAQDKVTTTLEEGWNKVLLKVVDYGGAWAACLRVRAPDGGPLPGLKIDAKAQP